MRRLVVLADGEQAFETLVAHDRNGHAPAVRAPAPADTLKEVARRAAGEAELRVIEEVLERVHWNRAEAARILKVSYKTLLNKIAEHRLAPPGRAY